MQAEAEGESRLWLHDALRRCEQTIERDQNDPVAYNTLGNVLQQFGRHEDAIAQLDRAIALKPDYPEAYGNRGDALLALKRFADAIESYDRAIALDPEDATLHNNLGSALKNLRRYNEAADCYRQAIALLPQRAELHNNLGNVLQELERLDEAIECYETALKLKPDYVEAYSNRGAAFVGVERFEEAMANFDKALALMPDNPEASFGKAVLCLLLGQFDTGWRAYEARKRIKKAVGSLQFPRPLWLGEENIAGKTLLVHAEQGFGDTIMFSRYLALCQEAGARVLFAPQKPLKTVMRGLHAGVQIVDLKSDVLLFDYHCPMMSLPLAFRTEATTIPRAPYLSADEDRIAAWSSLLGEKRKPRVGVLWGRNDLPVSKKTIALDRFRRLFLSGIEFVSLQKHLTQSECSCLDRAGVRHPGEALFDFSDTAALCCLMDLVVTIDTAVAHLAGALGVPVWVLLPTDAGWVWLLDRDDSPWYPSMRLFRQRVRGDWEGVLERVELALKGRFQMTCVSVRPGGHGC